MNFAGVPNAAGVAMGTVDASNNVLYTTLSNLNFGWVHADVRSLNFAYGNSNKLIMTTDGGVFMLDNTGSTPTWYNLNSNIATSEVVGLAYDPISDTYVACLQDNGCIQSVAGKYKTDGLFSQIGSSDGTSADTDLNDVSTIGDLKSSRIFLKSIVSRDASPFVRTDDE